MGGLVLACTERDDLQTLHFLPQRFKGLDGQWVDFDPKAGPFLINYWATWCPPCRNEMAGLERIHRQYSALGLHVLCIAVDSDAFMVSEFALKERLTVPIVLDPDGVLARREFRVSAYPTTFLLDRDGKVVTILIGERDWDSLEMRRQINVIVA